MNPGEIGLAEVQQADQSWGQTLSPKQIAEVTAYLIAKLPEDFKDVPVK